VKAKTYRNETRETTQKNPALPKEEIAFVTVLAWFVPGAGHWRLGYRMKAVVYGLTVQVLLLLGAVLGNFSNVSSRHHPFSFILQVFAGVVSLALSMITSTAIEYTPDPTRVGDIGMTLTLIAGALNVLLIADAFDRACGGPFDTEEHKPSIFSRLLAKFGGRKK